jgi:hypothetical protein
LIITIPFIKLIVPIIQHPNSKIAIQCHRPIVDEVMNPVISPSLHRIPPLLARARWLAKGFSMHQGQELGACFSQMQRYVFRSCRAWKSMGVLVPLWDLLRVGANFGFKKFPI